jgi:hypothetical protein
LPPDCHRQTATIEFQKFPSNAGGEIVCRIAGRDWKGGHRFTGGRGGRNYLGGGKARPRGYKFHTCRMQKAAPRRRAHCLKLWADPLQQRLRIGL